MLPVVSQRDSGNFHPEQLFRKVRFPCVVDMLCILRHSHPGQSNVLKSYLIDFFILKLPHLSSCMWIQPFPYGWTFSWFLTCLSLALPAVLQEATLHKQLDVPVFSSLSHEVPELTLLGQISCFILRNTNKDPFPWFYSSFWCNFPVAYVYIWRTWSCGSFIFLTIKKSLNWIPLLF